MIEFMALVGGRRMGCVGGWWYLVYDGVFEVEPQVQARIEARGKEVRWGW